jgi:CheY-like chemotaxis protein
MNASRTMNGTGTFMHTPRILVVDDDPRYLELLEFMLRGEGFDVRTAQDSATVQDIAAAEQPDVIVSDVAMPGVDGYALAAGLKTDPRTRRIPLLFVTARGYEGESDNLISGAAACLAKPFSTSDLIAAIQRLMTAAQEENRS